MSSSTTHIEVGWEKPQYEGGCPVLGYQIFIQDQEVTAVINDDPNLSSYSIDMSSATQGAIYKVKARATNYAGHVDSNFVSVALASLPAKPLQSPESIPSITNTQ